MKKTIAIVLGTILLIISSVTPSSAYPEDYYIDEDAKEKYFDQLYEQYDYKPPKDNLFHLEEVYNHKNESGVTDWAIIHIHISKGGPTETVAGVVGGKRVHRGYPEWPFTIPYGLYDAQQDIFVSIWENRETICTDYEGFYEAWQSLELSCIKPESIGIPKGMGDADGSIYMDIMDATHIQRYIVGIVSKYLIDAYEADVDRDGNITILDATRIQRTLANLCKLDGSPYQQ